MSKKHGAAESRRSTAAQFFMDEELVVEPKKVNTVNTYERVVELINQAAISTKDSNKVSYLKQAQELIVHKESNLLDNFLDEMLAFQSDKSVDVRKFVIGFMEEACKKDPEILPKIVANLNIMLSDESSAVQKRLIQAATLLYKVTLKWLCTSKSIDEIMESTWAYMGQLKGRIVTLLDSDNDGVRTHTIKFLEMLVIVQTYPDSDSPKKTINDLALDDVPATLKIARPRKLEEEAKQMFESLVIFHGTPHISSVNLMACMQTLTSIARYRCEFMSKVVQALEALNANLPPTLAKSQVSSVRKHLKLQLLILLKHPASVDFHGQITTLLTDLGATSQEINKCLPKPEEIRKRARLTEEGNVSTKRIKLEDEGDEDDREEEIISEPPPPKLPKNITNTAIDLTAEDIVPKLTPINVTDIVLVSMLGLPDTMPAHFQSAYTPIDVAGTQTQIQHLSRLISTQLTALGLGIGVEEMKKVKEDIVVEDEDPEPEPVVTRQSIQTLVGGKLGRDDDKKKKSPCVLLPMAVQTSSRRIKQVNLAEMTKPLSAEQAEKLSHFTLERLFKAEPACAFGGAAQARTKILANLATVFRGKIAGKLKDYIFEDMRGHAELALSWLYEEYATYQCFNQVAVLFGKPSEEFYDHLLCKFLLKLMEKSDQKEKDILFSRFFMEVPSITDSAVQLFSQYCQDESTVVQGLTILRSVIEKRPPKQLYFLFVLLDLTLSEKAEIRNQSVKVAKLLYERGDLRPIIERFALKTLKFLQSETPPAEIAGEGTVATSWNEEHIKMCLHLYLALLPINHKLIHNLASVYVSTVADIKRTILRVLEAPVKGMGMSSPELLLLVEDCPKGAETLVTRVIHILTDKAPPSAELVSRVRDLYHKRVPDVRFLIPVLNGLSKKEVVAALPKLIKLNPIVVKEVFNRLLGTHAESGSSFTSPLTPAELLIALHNIDPSKCDMKTIIKATSMCFAEKHIYTQEILAVVMQQLMEQNPLPTLLMRTVIQSLSLYPRLIGFVMNILQRLILKQVWKQKKVWEGFIKCCQRTKPQSLQVLLQLPPAQLANVFEVSPDLREPLVQHVAAFTEHQRGHIPQEIMDLVMGGQDEPEETMNEDVSSITDREAPLQMEIQEFDPNEPLPPGHELSGDMM